MIDLAIADIVREINALRGIQTYTACQGTTTRPAYVLLSWTNPAARKRLSARFHGVIPIHKRWGVVLLKVPGAMTLPKRLHRKFGSGFICHDCELE